MQPDTQIAENHITITKKLFNEGTSPCLRVWIPHL